MIGVVICSGIDGMSFAHSNVVKAREVSVLKDRHPLRPTNQSFWLMLKIWLMKSQYIR